MGFAELWSVASCLFYSTSASIFYVMFRQHYLNSLRCGLEHKLVNVLELSFLLNLAAVASIKLTFTDWIFSHTKRACRKIVTMYRRLPETREPKREVGDWVHWPLRMGECCSLSVTQIILCPQLYAVY